MGSEPGERGEVRSEWRVTNPRRVKDEHDEGKTPRMRSEMDRYAGQ